MVDRAERREQPASAADAFPVTPSRSTGSLALLGVPAIFTQDELLDTNQFIDRAKDHGLPISLDTLQDLHSRNLLYPLYRVSDIPVEGRRIPSPPPVLPMNVVGWVWEAASQGRLRDPYHEGYNAAWPYHRPADEGRRWWNGFVYSSWQLVDLPRALHLRRLTKALNHTENHHHLAIRRNMTLALSALSVKVLPAVLGKLNIPLGMTDSDMWQVRADSSTQDLLAHTTLAPEALRTCAEELLRRAHTNDPLIKWLPLIRHANYRAWSQLRDQPLNCMWHRIAAEVLLAAHDDLADQGHLPSLPDLSGSTWRTELHDRLTVNHPEADTLERTLGDFGLSPYPKVLVLVEGETELHHIPRLLAEVGLTQPQQVRVQRGKGSAVNPHLIARYNITPRVGRRIGDRWLLDATGTALVIAMDPENRWATAEKRDTQRTALLEAIREEVRSQGAEIPDEYLNYLVTVRVWGDDKYELANFTDDELIDAISQLVDSTTAQQQHWRTDLQDRLKAARDNHDDIKVPIGQMRIRAEKARLADLLWPTLRSKLEHEFATDDGPTTPVIKLIDDIIRIHGRMSGIRAM